MQYPFTKMHGAGNDYVYIDCFDVEVANPSQLSVRISDRHFGIGSDGLILIMPSDVADCRMRMFNADGSESQMCGNGIRCVGKYMHDSGRIKADGLTVETLAGIKHLSLDVVDGVAIGVSVSMGKAIWAPKDIPLAYEGEAFVSQPVIVLGQTYHLTALSMGNPHAVAFLDNVDGLDLEKIGPLFENHTLFPQRVNTEFIEQLSPETLKMRVWERGSGETFACGTGACAAAVAAVRTGRSPVNTPIAIHLKGGTLHITVSEHDEVTLYGPAVTVFKGVIDTDMR